MYDIELNIHKSPNRVRYSMNSFVISVGTFYSPLEEKALEVAKNIGKIYVDMGETNTYIQKAINKKRR